MSSTYAVIKDSVVINTVLADAAYAQKQGWILVTGGAGIGWSYINGQFVPPASPTPTPEQIQAQNKSMAVYLLQETDWTATVDISNPQYSDPYLANQEAFLDWRSQVRKIAVNPPAVPASFPPEPQEIWLTV